MGYTHALTLALGSSFTALTILTVRVMQQVALCHIGQCNVTHN